MKVITKRSEWALLVILLAAAFLRFHQLSQTPPGLTHDEAGHGHDAVVIRDGARPIYQTVGYGREPLFDYLLAGWIGLVGVSIFSLRLAAAILSLLLLSITYRWVRESFGRATALVTVALLAVSFWPVATGRQILRSGLLPLLFTGAAYAFWVFFHKVGARQVGLRALRQNESLSDLPRPYPPRMTEKAARPAMVVLFVLCLAGSIYTYLPARVLWLVFPLFTLILWFTDRPAFHRVWRPLLLALFMVGILVAPLFVYLRAHPEAEQRLAMLDEPLQALREGDLQVVLGRAGETLTSLMVPGRGDGFLAYNLPGRPIFDPLTGLLFLVGFFLSIWRWRRPAYSLALVWFAVSISPSLITGADASFTRSITAMPIVYLFPAVAITTLISHFQFPSTRYSFLVTLLLIATAALTYRDYFIAWGQSADVRAAYRHTIVEAARFLRDEPGESAVVFSTLYPQETHDPYVAQLGLRRDDLSLSWIDARRALLIPAGSSARLVVPASTPLDGYFAALPGLGRPRRIEMRPDDLNPYFDVYDWAPAVTYQALLDSTLLAADFGPVRLVGYHLSTPLVAPGGMVEVATIWRVVAPPGVELVFFTHALDAAGAVIGQEDRLDAPAWAWRPGDVIVQIHRFPLQSELAPGPAVLEVGVYRREDLVRLPLAAGGDRVVLATIEVSCEE